MEEIIAFMQWPAMAISLASAWWMGSKKAKKRIVAFIMLIIGNILWIVWGWSEDAFALIALNLGLMGLNVRAIIHNIREKA